MPIDDPRDIPGLVAWYSPEYEAANYTDGQQLTTVTDLSGNNNHATAFTVGAAKPLYKATGGPAGLPGGQRFRFEAGGYISLPSGIMGSSAAGEIMCKVKGDYATSTAQGWWKFGSDAGNGNHYPFTTDIYDDFGITARTNTGHSLSLDAWRRCTVWAATNDWAFHLDSVQQGVITTRTVGWATVPKIGNGKPGTAGSATTDTFEGDYGAIVLYNRKLTTTERADLAAWMDANPSGGTPVSPPDVPTDLTATPNSTSILFGWAAPSTGDDPTGYRVRIDGGTPIDVGLVNSHLFNGLTPETTYTLEVQAYNEAGDSAWVSIEETTPPVIVESFVTGVISTCPQTTVTWEVEPISMDLFVTPGAVDSAGGATLAEGEPVLVSGPTTIVWNNPGLTDYRPALFVECPGVRITGMSSTCFTDQPVEAEDCFDDYIRSLHSVTTINGPSVTAKMPLSDGAEAWSVQFTAVAANPSEFGADIPLISGFLNPAVNDPYVGGLPDGATYDEAGFVQDEPDCPVPVYSPLYDPLCPAVVPPPPLPNVALSCFTFPPNYVRRFFTIPAQQVPEWTDVIPVFSVSAPNGEVRNLRLRFYADPTGDTDPNDDPCSYLADVVFSYIPDDATIVMDGTDNIVYASDEEGLRRADSLLFSTDGTPFTWPVLACGHGYVVTVDLPQTGNLPVIDMTLVPRIR